MFDVAVQPSRDSGARVRTPTVSARATIVERAVPVPVVDELVAPVAALPLAPLGGLLDVLDEGIVLFRADSQACYRNAAADKLLRSDADSALLTREMRSVSRTALGSPTSKTAELEVGTRKGWYRIRATRLKQRIKEIGNHAVLVTIQRAQAPLPSPEFLMRSFALTAREARVALLLARGFRNSKIASELQISPHTARHHTDKVLTKLNVHGRAEVASAVVSGQQMMTSCEPTW